MSLQLRGAEVFRNTVCTGMSDLAMLYKDVTYYIDFMLETNYDCISTAKTVWSATRAYQVKSHSAYRLSDNRCRYVRLVL